MEHVLFSLILTSFVLQIGLPSIIRFISQRANGLTEATRSRALCMSCWNAMLVKPGVFIQKLVTGFQST